MEQEIPWYANHVNLSIMADYMNDRNDTVEDIIYMLEKPWKYDDEFKTARAELDAEIEADKSRESK